MIGLDDPLTHHLKETMSGINMNPPGQRISPEQRAFREHRFTGPPVVTVPTRKLHPLHTAKSIAEQVLMTGEYPDKDRGTGRTTILALEAIVEALKNPGKRVQVRDHPDSVATHRTLVRLIHDMAGALNLSFLVTSESQLSVTFERREAPSATPFAAFRPFIDPNQPIA